MGEVKEKIKKNVSGREKSSDEIVKFSSGFEIAEGAIFVSMVCEKRGYETKAFGLFIYSFVRLAFFLCAWRIRVIRQGGTYGEEE